MKFNYNCYNLKVGSDLKLPELIATSSDARKNDVRIHLRDLSGIKLTSGTQIAPYIWSSRRTLMLNVPGVARFLISNGEDIAIDPSHGVDEASIRVFLMGSAFGALLLQRGLFVLHGNAVEIEGKCLVCVGPSGVGKSTLTAAFMKRGYRVLADDVVPIDANCLAIPGFPRIKIWQDTADKMDIDIGNLTRIRPSLMKFSLPLEKNFCEIPRLVSQICELSEYNDNSVDVAQIHGVKKFQVLQANSYRPRFIAGMNLQTDQLRQCSTLAGKISVARVRRPKIGFEVDMIVDALLDNML